MKPIIVFEDSPNRLEELTAAAAAVDDCEIIGTARNAKEAEDLVIAVAAGNVAALYALVDGNLEGDHDGAGAYLVLDLLRKYELLSRVVVIDFSTNGFGEFGMAPPDLYLDKSASVDSMAQFLRELPVLPRE